MARTVQALPCNVRVSWRALLPVPKRAAERELIAASMNGGGVSAQLTPCSSLVQQCQTYQRGRVKKLSPVSVPCATHGSNVAESHCDSFLQMATYPPAAGLAESCPRAPLAPPSL